MKTIRVGIIGNGVIGPTHAEGFRRIPGVELAWACDLVEDKARRLAEKYAIGQITTDYREVIADPKVTCVAVCTDHASHAPITVAALKAGKHVLCEKALAATAKGMTAMLAAHRRDRKSVV
jgi:predicted dehydrogenase